MISKLLGGLFALIGYVCTATVITAVAGVLYLWKTDRLNDEKMFRMVALYHDVDLNQLAEAQRKATDQVPPEEVALDQALRRQQVMDRNFEVKLLQLRKGRQEYDYRLKSLNELIGRYDRMAQDWENRLKKQQELTTQEKSATTVVKHLELLSADNAKEELMRWLEEDRMDDVILMMSKMSEKKLGNILKKFQTDKELTKLKEIHQRLIDSKDKTSNVKNALDELKALGSGN